ncbi:MAG: FHA domain-containing protein [Cellvibrionales bacterium]|nr:FHA domain-containing protein [Cellvibrionales bacterium]
MAFIVNLTTKEKIYLLSQHLLGRHPLCDTVINYPNISRKHAVINWLEGMWRIEDVSLNGVVINGVKMPSNASFILSKGDILQFADYENSLWQVDDLTPPQSMLIPESEGASLILLDKFMVLPSEASPEISLYQSQQGQWLCESLDGVAQLKNQDVVGCRGLYWRFIEENADINKTQASEYQLHVAASKICLQFSVSQNEEHVHLTVQIPGYELNLGERNHHYLMLLLARKLEEDRTSGLAQAESGWLSREALMDMLKISEHHLNILIYRFRKQVLEATPETLLLPQLIDKRKKHIRISNANIAIFGGFVAKEAISSSLSHH